MKLSAFNLYIDDYPTPGATLVHNTFSGAYVVLERTVLEALCRVDRGELAGEEVTGGGDLDVVAELADPDVGILVTSHCEEERAYKDWFEWKRSRRTLQSIVGINLACNFDCPYCCQAGIMDGSVMSPEVAEQTADWLATRALEIAAEAAHVVFVGGEPLLHVDRIKTLVARLRARVEPSGVPVTIGLITNGYFLDEEMVSELLPYGLTVASVTLDGDETTHHLTRVSRKGENTFSRIFANVVAASRRLRININGNYQQNTVTGFGPLIDKLAAAGMPLDTKITFSPALEALAAPSGSGSGTCTWGAAAAGHRVALHDRILGHGFTTASLDVIGPCGFHERHLYVVDHQGNLFKCPGFLGHPDWRIGHIRTGLGARYDELLQISTGGQCSGCAHQPACAGGCVAHEMLRTGSTQAVNCELEYFETVARDALPRGYLLATHDDVKSAVAKFPPSSLKHSNDLASVNHETSRNGRRVPGLQVL